MDLAQTLIRSYARTFYGVEHILVLDAVIVHSALPGDDLAHVLGSQVKHTRKLCNRLRDDGLLHLHIQQEIRQGAFRAGNREYYYINMHNAIDNIKWRMKSLAIAVDAKYGQTEEEKKDYFCTQCKSDYTEMEVLDSVDFEGNFFCKKCGKVLTFRQDAQKNTVGRERQARLNNQLDALQDIMQRIDNTNISENDWQHAYENRRPVERDQTINPGVKSEVVNPKVGPTTVHGKQLEQEKLQVELHDTVAAQEAENRKKEMDRNAAAQNALPVWHTTSTVTGEQTELGRKEAELKWEREANYGISDAKAVEKEKKAVSDMEESDAMRAYKAAVRAAALQEAAEDGYDDEGEEDEDDEDDEDEFENVELAPNKRVKFEEAAANTPNSSAPSPNGEVNIHGTNTLSVTVNGIESKADADEEDSDEDADFEDVL